MEVKKIEKMEKTAYKISILKKTLKLGDCGGLTENYDVWQNAIYCNDEHMRNHMNRTTVYLSDEHLEQLSNEVERTGQKTAEIIRNALSWYFGLRDISRDALIELLTVYEEFTPEQIIIKLVADDKCRREERNTTENGIAAIKEDTGKILSIVEREFGDKQE